MALGLPDFGPVQNNISFNASRGATRGIHTEPWDKYISLATGRIFGAWVDMREGETFGTTFHIEIDPSVAVFVPRGVGNSYQALEDDTAYTYLVNDHWRPGVSYPALHLGDESAGIPWPIPLDEAEISEKDHNNPRLADVVPMQPKKTLIVGALGQLGRALHGAYPEADRVDLFEGDGVERARPDRCRGRGRMALARVRRRAQRRGLHRRRRRRDRRGPGDRLGRQRLRSRRRSPGWRASTASRSSTSPPSTSSTAPLRSSPATPRTSRCPRWASTPSPRPPATSRSVWRRATTSCAPAG